MKIISMEIINRRNFLQKAIALGAMSTVSFPSFSSAAPTRLAFSTLGCPAWDLGQIVSFATKHKYQGLEFRGLHGELDLLKSPYFSAANLPDTKRLIQNNNLTVVCLGSSAQMHHRDESRMKHLEEAKRYIDLAERLECTFVRVFPEKLMGGEEKRNSMKWISDNLGVLADHAKGTRVTVVLESHGDLVNAADLREVLSATHGKPVGMIWDIVNMWAVTGQDPAEVYRILGPFIRHVHVKDFVRAEGKLKYVFPGTGIAPIAGALDQLKGGGYDGFYSFEWEKLWHPELDEPETVFALYPDAINNFLR